MCPDLALARTRLRSVLIAGSAAGLAVAVLISCGSDDPAPTTGPADSDEAVEQSLERTEDGPAGVLGNRLVQSLAGASGYRVEDGDLIVEVDRTSTDGGAHCTIATTSRDALGEDFAIAIEYDDTTQTC